MQDRQETKAGESKQGETGFTKKGSTSLVRRMTKVVKKGCRAFFFAIKPVTSQKIGQPTHKARIELIFACRVSVLIQKVKKG